MRCFSVTFLTMFFLLAMSEYSYSDVAADIEKGKIEFKNKRMEHAKQFFLAALRRNPDSIEAKIELSKVYRRDSRNYEIEESLVEEVLKADPGNKEALHLRGQIYYRNENWIMAGKIYKKILSIYPGDYTAHISLSVILRELGDLEGVHLLSKNMKKMHQPALGESSLLEHEKDSSYDSIDAK